MPYIPAVKPPGCRERRTRRDRRLGGWAAHPFTDAASRVFTHQTVASARNRASGFGGAWRVRQQLPGGVGLMIGQRKLATGRR
ncbi:TPA: hypothetical protein JFV33_004069 [Salmonella enterica]|nr:hypothetical protein [Salmonella enterica]